MTIHAAVFLLFQKQASKSKDLGYLIHQTALLSTTLVAQKNTAQI